MAEIFVLKFLSMRLHAMYEFCMVVACGLSGRKIFSGICRCSAVLKLATLDLFRTVSCWPGTLMVMVESLVLTSVAPPGMASYKPWSCFLFREVARFLRANWSRGLFLASGSSNLADWSLILGGTLLLSSLASCSFRRFVSWTSASISRFLTLISSS